MFTGIVSGMATVQHLSGDESLCTLTLSNEAIPSDVTIGDSVCIAGCCLTVIERTDATVSFEVMGETVAKTTIGALQPGDRVNIECSLRPTTQMGGHMVSGHVDGIGEVRDIRENDGWKTIFFRVPDTIKRLVAPKGSITINGTSLTIIDVDDQPSGTVISIGFIPHTLATTTHGLLAVGDRVNMEADLLARYMLRLIETKAD
ncbi:riboflavin synthase [Stomatohabitans albus]|uniref:riboflavin synthase n=1 Tax=Stomatohabitans albus TaxID=3110766 RepID=UPI00300C242D